MAKMSKEDKKIEKAVDDAFKAHGSNIQFDMFDLAKISDAGRKAGKEGKDIVEAVKAAIQQYRKS